MRDQDGAVAVLAAIDALADDPDPGPPGAVIPSASRQLMYTSGSGAPQMQSPPDEATNDANALRRLWAIPASDYGRNSAHTHLPGQSGAVFQPH
jgi:hypothetical protein